LLFADRYFIFLKIFIYLLAKIKQAGRPEIKVRQEEKKISRKHKKK